jgi:GalNAc-alpha-(1->4)-GalNAc-alpha-(1->3)-diNAcBac-PP-undecaprenol alpha-1,4-N-acetyl-D-galactosaminyltransferase
MPKQKVITFVIYTLQCGGAERVISIMANYWAEKGYDIFLLTFDGGSVKPFYSLHNRVKHIPLNLQTTSSQRVMAYYENGKRILGIRKAVTQIKPDVIISFIDMANIFVLAATRGLGIPLIVSERSNPFLYKIGRNWDRLRHLLYPFADAIVVQSDYVRPYFSKNLQGTIHTIPNPVLKPASTSRKPFLTQQPGFVAVGRFTEEKGFDLLILAFASISIRHPDITLTIIGDGPMRGELETLIQSKNLQQRIFLPGKVANIYTILQQSEIFILSSKFEGFPNALCEAMASGLPVIATDCPFGPKDIVRHNIDGLLVPPGSIESLAEAMVQMISDTSFREQCAKKSIEITNRFHIDTIMAKWEKLINIT